MHLNSYESPYLNHPKVYHFINSMWFFIIVVSIHRYRNGTSNLLLNSSIDKYIIINCFKLLKNNVLLTTLFSLTLVTMTIVDTPISQIILQKSIILCSVAPGINHVFLLEIATNMISMISAEKKD